MYDPVGAHHQRHRADAAELEALVEAIIEPLLAQLDAQDLDYLAGLMRAGKVTPVIDRRFTLDQVAQAVGYVEAGRARGKVVVTIDAGVPEGS